MKCNKCGTDNPTNSKFCCECGSKLEKLCPKCQQPVAENMKFCFACGASLTEQVQVSAVMTDNVIAGDVDMSTHTNVVNNYNSTTTVYQNVETRAFKCKICGQPLEVNAKESVVTCTHCNMPQAVPKMDDEKRAMLYERANHYLRNKDFDKAMSAYEDVLKIDNTDAEAYWSIVLCKYGIEYVNDPQTFEQKPTCHRASYDPIITDEDYKSAIQYASRDQRTIYEGQAKEIDRVQKDILALAQKEEKYDVFISYKETDDVSGRRTIDSALANDIYYHLKQEGFKVFYAAITLEDKLGSAYEPIIFAALNSAKVMLVVGTKPEYMNAVWVKNEWSRYLKIIGKDRSKLLIPCYRDMDAYELPEEFSHLQAQNMAKIGFINDLVRGIKKVVQKDEPKQTVVTNTVSAPTAPLLKRAFLFLEDGNWDSASEYCEKVLDHDPENAQAYLGKLMVELSVQKQEDLKNYKQPFHNNNNYKKAIRFGDEKLKTVLTEYAAHAEEVASKAAEARKLTNALTAYIEHLRQFKFTDMADGTCSVSGTVSCNETIVIPHTSAKGKCVTSIGSYAFYGCTGLTSITIPDSVTSIGDYAFSGCTGLTSITIPDSVTSIGEYAFSGCTGLTSITIPDSVTSIGFSAFRRCTGLTSITIPDSMTSTGAGAFAICTSLSSITIPNSVTSIDNFAFYNCTGLTSITIPNSVTSIDNSAFYNCTGLTSITIPDSVTSIGAGAFYNCTGLTSITIPDSVTSIGTGAFNNCTGLTSITIPDSVTKIAENAFDGTAYIEKKNREEAERNAREEAERNAREEAERNAREEAERNAREEAERNARKEAERKARDKAALLYERRRNNLCQHCGGSFKGLFTKTCQSCGRKKDY